VDVKKVAGGYVVRCCRDGPGWEIRTAEAVVLDAASVLAWIWPMAHKALRKEVKKLGEEAQV
jgi:hypothetical protein